MPQDAEPSYRGAAPRSRRPSRFVSTARSTARLALAGALAASCVLVTAVSATADPGQDPPATDTLAEVVAAAADSGAVTSEEFARDAAVAADGPGSLFLDEEGRVSATVFWNEGDESVLDRIRAAVGGGEAVKASPIAPAASVWVDPARLDELREIPGVTGVTPNLRPLGSSVSLAERLESVRESLPGALASRSGVTGGPVPQAPTPPGAACGPIPIEADAPLRSDAARADYGVDGTGVTIGIISDSFADPHPLVPTPTSWDEDVASGALPGPGNPCGRTTPVTIVSDAIGGSDEGRAMAQLVHGIAPGAKILFADAGTSDFEMAANVARLVDAGADIIVDDISWFQEPFFQQGIVSSVYGQARQDDGVLAISAAGNSTAVATEGNHIDAPLPSWQTDAYRPMACPSWLLSGAQDPLYGRTDIDCLDFDPGVGEQPYDLLAFAGAPGDPEHLLTVAASIGEPMYGVTTQYEIRFYEEDASGTPQPRFRIPMVGAPYAGLVGTIDMNPGSQVRMVFVRTSYDQSSPSPAVFIGFPKGATAITERQFMGNPEAGAAQTDRVGPITLGHNGDGSTISVAAVSLDDPTVLRPYSSIGPSTLLFDRVAIGGTDPAAPLQSPVTVSAPHIAAVDGARTTFFGQDAGAPGAPVYRFLGTSAAAPKVAAVAALGLDFAPGASADELNFALIGTARGTAAGGPKNPYDPALFPDSQVFGAGLVDAQAMLRALAQTYPPVVDPGGGSGGSGGSSGSGGSGGGGSQTAGGGTGGSASGSLSATGAPAAPTALGAIAAAILLLGASAMLAGQSRRRAR